MRRIIIMGAAGRDFHVFNCCFRNYPDVEVLAFTATQIPHIEDRRYPASLAGSLYPEGIPIHPEAELETLLEAGNVDEVVFAYSDVSLDYVDERRRRVEAKGVRFDTFDIDATMLPASKPVIAVTAVRTGCGKSQVSRRIAAILGQLGKKTVAVRHPMPYGHLESQAVQRFASREDLDRHDYSNIRVSPQDNSILIYEVKLTAKYPDNNAQAEESRMRWLETWLRLRQLCPES